MIQLNTDCMNFGGSDGEMIPCSAEKISIELLGSSMEHLDPEMVTNAALAVMHFFKHDQGRESVSMGEFSEALEKVLRSMGLDIKAAHAKPNDQVVGHADLLKVAVNAGSGFELAFFKSLQEELNEQLRENPKVVVCKGLRCSVKFLLGAKRWNMACQQLNDQIVHYVRRYWETMDISRRCTLVMR